MLICVHGVDKRREYEDVVGMFSSFSLASEAVAFCLRFHSLAQSHLDCSAPMI